MSAKKEGGRGRGGSSAAGDRQRPATSSSSSVATASAPPLDMEADLDWLEKCAMCREQLRSEREPKLLPCLHSLCKECLKAEPASGKDGGQGVECPVCQHHCGLEEVVENYFLKDGGATEPPGEAREANQHCTACEDNATATSFCVACQEPLCKACVAAHKRARYTKDHTILPTVSSASEEKEKDVFCSVHKGEPLELFCDTCDTLICRDCQQNAHKEHQCQGVEEAAKNQRKMLASLIKRLGDKNASLQKSAKEVRTSIQQVVDAQKRLQMDVNISVLQIMKELNKRASGLVNDVQKVTERQQEKLKRQDWVMTKLQSHQEHILRFVNWALESDNNAALMLSKKPIYFQLHRALKMIVDPVEPHQDLKFQWDLDAWIRSAETFGQIVWERRGLPVASGGTAVRKGSVPPSQPTDIGDGFGVEGSYSGEGSEKKRPRGKGGDVTVRKVPQVSLQALDMPPPVFKAAKRPTTEKHNTDVIEQGGQGGLAVKEEQVELAIERPGSVSDAEDTKPILPSVPRGVSPSGSTSSAMEMQSVHSRDGAAGEVKPACCKVCLKAGAVVLCDGCKECYHLGCHVPALWDIPDQYWKCILCEDPAIKIEDDGSDMAPIFIDREPKALSNADKKRCERVLLELLCSKPFRPLHRLSKSKKGQNTVDLTLIRGKLQGKLSPPYSSPDEFVDDVWKMVRQFNTLREGKGEAKSMVLQRFFEAKLSAAFGDRKFSALCEPINVDEPQKENTRPHGSPLADLGEAAASKPDVSGGDEGTAT